MTNKQKLEKLLQYYMDCYAHCEGSGCWDYTTLINFWLEEGMCLAWHRGIFGEGNITDFLPPPSLTRQGYWFPAPINLERPSQRRAAIKVRINYMKKYL